MDVGDVKGRWFKCKFKIIRLERININFNLKIEVIFWLVVVEYYGVYFGLKFSWIEIKDMIMF